MFDNLKLFSPNKTLLGYISKKKANWYISKNLATWTNKTKTEIRLNFEPAGPGSAEDSYNFQGLPNICFVCGESENIRKTSLIPHFIKNHFPEKYKGRDSHDMIIFCDTCFSTFQLHMSYACNFLTFIITDQKNAIRVAKKQIAAKKYNEKQSKNKLRALKEEYPFLKGWRLSDLDRLNDDVDVGKIITTLCSPLRLTRLFRQFFKTTMNPRFLPDHWSVNHVPVLLNKSVS